MTNDEVRNAVHAIVSRVHSDFETELAKLDAQHEAALQRVREEVAREATEKVRSEIEARTAADLAAKLEAALAQARQEAADERARLSGEIEAERARLHADRSGERQQFSTEIEAERAVVRALTAELDQVRAALTDLDHARAAVQRLETAQKSLVEERDAAHAALAAAQDARAEEAITGARAVERQEQLAIVENLLSGVRTIGAARSLSDTLTALTTAAGTLAPRAALFIVNGPELQGWRAAGFDSSPSGLRLPNERQGLLAVATATAAVVSTEIQPAPAFAALPADRAGLAVPITVGGKAVAVLYADDAGSGEPEAPASWPEAMEILGLHASACLSHITALRTTQAMRAKTPPAGPSVLPAEEESSARRYARLLVSEIKLYNESAVRLGREKRDLLTRLRPEIDRARRLYEERVSPSITSRGTLFQEELVHTLADGDRELLGSA